MSSIRPLATITLLAVAGLVLYWKITETEPVIPDGVGEYEFNVGLDSGLDAPAAWSTPSEGDPGATAPPFAATSPGGEAPAFAPTPGESAPPWGAPAADQATTSTAPSFDEGTAAAAPIASEPAMPELPGDESTAAVGTAAATAAVAAASSYDAYPAAPDLSTAPAADAMSAAAEATADVAATAPPASDDRYGSYGSYDPASSGSEMNADGLDETLPTDAAATTAAPTGGSVYAQSKLAIQSALDRGELSQALLMLSDWYGDPSLTPAEKAEVDTLLGQLAGSVIYSTEPRLEPEYRVQAGETLAQIAAKYSITPELLGKINGVSPGQPLAPGQELKVVRGPFSALIDLSEREMTLMLDRRYAGRFSIQVDTSLTVEDGQWEVVDKPLAPASATSYQAVANNGVDRTVMLQNPSAASGQVAVLRGPGAADPVAPEPSGRVIRLQSNDIVDVFDILSVGSRVTIRR
ncbi:MAG: LysM peptidoglycan-binding domain-containing protein [Planctomycetales bacterium]|nr:LysM peptidoglycan-binding domain-containing protein [Planctomycetales bacterium]